jgi:DNA-binding MarR family transcriptional regulator
MPDRPDQVDGLLAAWRVELPDVLGPSSELIKRITVLGVELADVTRRVLPQFGLTVAQYDVLTTLRRSGPPYRLKPTELSRSLLLSTGGTSNVINFLVAQGLVERLDDPADRRGALIQLTERGVAVAEDAVRANTAAHAAVFEKAPAAVVETATRALRELSGFLPTR